MLPVFYPASVKLLKRLFLIPRSVCDHLHLDRVDHFLGIRRDVECSDTCAVRAGLSSLVYRPPECGKWRCQSRVYRKPS